MYITLNFTTTQTPQISLCPPTQKIKFWISIKLWFSKRAQQVIAETYKNLLGTQKQNFQKREKKQKTKSEKKEKQKNQHHPGFPCCHQPQY